MFEEQLKAVPAEPPRPYKLLPGLRYGAGTPRALLIFLLIFMCVFASVPIMTILGSPESRLAHGHGITAEGHVVSVSDSSSSCKNDGRRLTFAFTPPQGTEYRGTTVVCATSPYFAAKTGDVLPVRYLPADPSVNAIVAGKDPNAPPIFLFFFFPLIFGVLFGSVILPPLREVHRARQAYRKGRLTLGTVVYIKKRSAAMWSNMPSMVSHDVFVAYQHLGGATREGRAWCNNDWLLHQLAPGTTVHIAYLPDRSEQIVLLDGFLR